MIRGHLLPPPNVVFSRNTPNRNIEIAILFKIVQRSNNKVFVVETNPKSRSVKVVSYDPGVFNILMKGMDVQPLE